MTNVKNRVYLVLAIALLALIIFAPKMCLLIFGGYIFHVFLSSISAKIEKSTPLPYSLGLGLTLAILLVLFVGYWIYLVPTLSDQIAQFSEKVPALKNRVIDLLTPYFSESMLKKELSLEHLKEISKGQAFLSELNALAAGVLFFITSILVVFIIGIYFSISPAQYRQVLKSLVPPKRRKKADDIFTKVHDAIKWWLVGRISSMGLVALLSILGLWILDIELALALGLFAGVASFIPNLGPIISVVPAALIALLESPQTALYVMGLYLGIQTIESYLITPFITDKVVSLPPAWLISLQLIAGTLLGILGLALAAPGTVVIVVLTRQIFIKNILGDDSIKSLV